MNLSRSTILAAVLAVAAASSGPAAAQGFFERLFGVRPLPPPPASVPQQERPLPPPPPGVPGVPPSGWTPESGIPEGPVQPSGPAPARPVAMRPPTEEGILGRELKLNGTAGSLRIDRAGQGLRAQVALTGTKISQPSESCSIKLGGGEPLPLSSLGRADGLPRYEVQVPACPIAFDVVEGAVIVTAPAEACMIQDADCQVEPRGLWGPDPASLLPRAADFEQVRGTADRAVRENYKALTQRASPQGARPIVAEQAAFSSEREQVCRSYAREGGHGFCNARFTEARAVTLAARLGLLQQPEPQAARPPRPRPPPVTEAMPPPGAQGFNPYYR
jgi:hypothetical protein